MSSSILLVENVMRLGMVAIVSLWIAHQLGPAQFGLLNQASALVAIFWAAAMLGLDTPLTARLTLTGQPGLSLGSAIGLRTVAGVLGGLAAMACALTLRGDEPEAVVLTAIVALSIPFSAPVVVDCWFKARNEALLPALARFAATLLSCGAKVGCLLLGFGIVGLAWTVALESLLVSIGLLLAFWKQRQGFAELRFAMSRSETNELMRLAWPFLLTTIVIAAFMKIDVVLLGALSTNEQTGLYSLSQKLAEVLYLAPVILIDVLFPQLVRQSTQDVISSRHSQQLFFDLAFAVALVATVLAVGTVVLALPHVFGDQYRATVGIFCIHAWACLGIAMYQARVKWMAAVGQQALAPWVTALGLVLAVIGHVWLIPEHGAAGAAIATVAAFWLSGWLASYAFAALRPAARMQTKALWPWGRLWSEWRTLSASKGRLA